MGKASYSDNLSDSKAQYSEPPTRNPHLPSAGRLDSYSLGPIDAFHSIVVELEGKSRRQRALDEPNSIRYCRGNGYRFGIECPSLDLRAATSQRGDDVCR